MWDRFEGLERFLSLTGLRPEDCGGRFAAVFEKGARLTAQVGAA